MTTDPPDELPGTARPADLAASGDGLLGQGLRVRRCRHGLMLYRLNDVFIGRSLDLYGEMNEIELQMQRSLVGEGDVVCDVGANIGVNTVPLANRVGPAGRVIAFEPQRIVHQMLCANAALNALPNVVAFWAAAGARQGLIRVPPVNYARPGNFGGVELGGGKAAGGEQVPMMTIDELGLKSCRLIKIDVEGMELDVLKGAARTIDRLKPRLYFENNRRDRSPALLGHLLQRGYRLHWHKPPLYNPDNFNGVQRNIFPGIISVDVVGLPPGDAFDMGEAHQIASADDWWK